MQPNIFTLGSLPIGKTGKVISLKFDNLERRRILDLGLVQGTTVEALQKSPFGNPRAYGIRGAVIALRNEDANKITVQTLI